MNKKLILPTHTTNDMKYKSIDVETIVNECLAENLQGWHKELWYDKNTKKFSFSSWMTQNSWNESNNDNDVHVCNFDAIHLIDCIGSINIFHDIDTEGLDETTITNCELYYKCEDGNNEINENFPLLNQRERILINIEQFSILNENEAIDALINIAENDGWFEDELEAIMNVKDGNYEVLEENY